MAADLHFTANGNTDNIWDFLMGFIHNKKGVAGLMGNLYYESQCYPYKVYGDNSIPPSMRSILYTEHYDQHDAGYDMNSFINDGKPYGLAQWLTPSRKQGLYEGRAHNSSAIRYPSSSYSLGSMTRGKDYIKYELLDVPYYSSDYNALVTATDERVAALTIVRHYEGISNDDGSFTTRQNLAEEIYGHYTGETGNNIYIDVVGNGIAYVDNYHPQDGETFHLYFEPIAPDTLQPNGVTATTSTGQSIAMSQTTGQGYQYDEHLWGNFINITVAFTGETPPSPPTPTPTRIVTKKHMPIWMYPLLK